MLILTEKPSVAKDFATALNCTFSKGAYRNSNIVITNCIGHLFKEEAPAHYGTDFPVIPEHWDYKLPDDENLAKHAKFVISLLKSHKNDTIIIATDADREGEIIARECLEQAGIFNFSNCKRFWVSQALTKEVILEGLKNADPLDDYNLLAEKGFARQHADWLVGMNFCRYISNAAGTKLTVGRVQTAILSAIEERCEEIKNFKSEKYFQHYGVFRPTAVGPSVFCKGIYFELEETINEKKRTGKLEHKKCFPDNSLKEKLRACIGKPAKLIDSKCEKKSKNPPQLYNLNAVQKDAFKFFGYSADKTLKIIQSLYEELKCVSYPRTPSRVMGSGNVMLCQKVADDLCGHYSSFLKLREEMNINLSNTRCFNDAQLEAHHALIPLKELSKEATEEQSNIYSLILERFFIAFLPEEQYEKQTFHLTVEDNNFMVSGKKIMSAGWKSSEYSSVLKYTTGGDRQLSVQDDTDENDEEQSLENINWNELQLSDIETKEKWTKPPKYFNEASILSFMENPKQNRQLSVEHSEDFNPVISIPAPATGIKTTMLIHKLTGLGTAATRHTFIPLLQKRGYISFEKKNIICTELGSKLLKAVRSSSIKELADVSTTTDWEHRLDLFPSKYLMEIKDYVRKSVKEEIKIELPVSTSGIICPACGKEIRKGKSNWYCTGYKEGCKFTLWENVAGAKLSEKDVVTLCSGKQTGIKHCTNKAGKKFDCKFELDEENKIRFVFGGNK